MIQCLYYTQLPPVVQCIALSREDLKLKLARTPTIKSNRSACRDGEQELIESMLRAESPESKLLLGLLSGSIITAGALVVCWLSGSSPAGMSWLVAIAFFLQNRACGV